MPRTLAALVLSVSFAVPAAAQATHEEALIQADARVVTGSVALVRRIEAARQAQRSIRGMISSLPRTCLPPGRGGVTRCVGGGYRLNGPLYAFRRDQHLLFVALRGAVKLGGRHDVRVRELALWGYRTRVNVERGPERVLSEDRYRKLGL